jgi:hypothetical protein
VSIRFENALVHDVHCLWSCCDGVAGKRSYKDAMKETQLDKEKQVWDSWQPGSCLPLGVLFDTGSRGTVWWSVHDVAFVATADSSEISNSVPAARSFAGDAHSARQSAAFSCPMAVACVQAENAARGSCGAPKQRVYRRCKRSETGMPGVNQRIKSDCDGECEGESAPSSLALWMAAST